MYCKHCGAYIPDGQTKCLACGYDELEERNSEYHFTGAAAAAQAKPQGQSINAQAHEESTADEQWKKSWENMKQRATDAEREYKRRAEEREKQEREAEERAYDAERFKNVSSGIKPGKVLGVMSYFSVLFLLPYLFAPDDKFSVFHAKQGLRLFIAGVVADIIGAILPIFAPVLGLFRIFFMIKGISNAAQGKMEKLPYIGNIKL